MTASRDLLLQLLDRAELRREHHVLELGCGDGWASRLLARMLESGRVYGAEVDERIIERARSEPHPPHVAFSAVRPESLPYATASLQRVIMHPVASGAWAPREELLREVRRVLDPDGLLLAAVEEQPAEFAVALRGVGFDSAEHEELEDRRRPTDGRARAGLHLVLGRGPG